MDETNVASLGGSTKLVEKWEKALDGINDPYIRKVTASLLENQARAIFAERQKVLSEAAVGTGTTTVGDLGTFQKFALPMVRRVYPELIFNKLGATQPMQGPVSQVFYLGNSRHYGDVTETIYSKYKLTYQGLVNHPIGSSDNATNTGTFRDRDGALVNADQFTSALSYGDASAGFDLSSVLRGQYYGSPSATFGGRIAGWPVSTTLLGWSVSAGERLTGTGIPEVSLHIQQQPVVARTRKMRALWTIEASQDLKAYHNLDLEQELTQLLSQELSLEIDRELIEDMRMIAYGLQTQTQFGPWYSRSLDNANSNNFQDIGGVGPGGATFAPSAWTYDFHSGLKTDSQTVGSNVFVVDLTQFQLGNVTFAPQHVGHVYANLMATLNFASQDIYRTAHRGPGSWIITSPLMGAMLESASKLEGGLERGDGPSNMGNNRIEFKGKVCGKYDLFIDPLYPEDEMLMGYRGSNAMDSGFVYCPYIPLQQLPTITDPESFQPRKGILSRYGKIAIQPADRFFRVIRVIGATANWLIEPFSRNTTVQGTSVGF